MGRADVGLVLGGGEQIALPRGSQWSVKAAANVTGGRRRLLARHCARCLRRVEGTGFDDEPCAHRLTLITERVRTARSKGTLIKTQASPKPPLSEASPHQRWPVPAPVMAGHLCGRFEHHHPGLLRRAACLPPPSIGVSAASTRVSCRRGVRNADPLELVNCPVRATAEMYCPLRPRCCADDRVASTLPAVRTFMREVARPKPGSTVIFGG